LTSPWVRAPLSGFKPFSEQITDPIKAGDKASWNGVWEYNQFIDSEERLKSGELKDLTEVWVLGKIIFSDETTLPKDIDNQ